MRYRLAIVDDKLVNLASLAEKINYSGTIEIVLKATNGEDFLRKMKELPAERMPQVVLMDIDMPVMNGIDAVKTAAAIYDDVHYLMLTVFDDDDKLFEAIQAGADGYLLKEERVDVILDAITDVLERKGAPMSPRIARKILNMVVQGNAGREVKKDAGIESILSEREMEILKGQVSGLDYKQIAEKLFISPNTVRKHIYNIYDKLHINSKAQAVKLAVRNKWFEG